MGIYLNHNSGDYFMAKIRVFFSFIVIILCTNAYAITIDEAVQLTLNNNFNIKSAKLDRQNQNYAVKVSKNAFEWQTSVTGTSTVMDNSSPDDNDLKSSTSITPLTSIRSTFGTEFSFEPNFHIDTGVEPEIVVKQHLLRGSSSNVNLVDLRNAIDQNEIDKLNYKNIVSQAISDTLTNYINIISTDRQIRSLKRSLKMNRDNLEQIKIKFQFGEAPMTDVINKRISVASTLSSLTASESERIANINTLLDTMNVHRKTITIDNNLFDISRRFNIPSQEKVTSKLLTNNLDYLTLKLNLIKNRRTLLKAEDDLRMDLTAVGTKNLRDSQDTSIVLNLDIPINNITKKQAVVNANVDIKKSETAIKNKEIELTNHAIDAVNELKLLEKSIKQEKQEVDLRVELVKTNQERFRRGFISAFQLSEQINEKEEAVDRYSDLVSNFASKLISLYNDMGITLDQWHVQLPKDF